jgi:NAD(P)-dependent dehydrogenase (short-subunit alcohol dehydrogenase family)
MTQILLLTGASTGLGLSVAVQAAQAGYKVYATMRDTAKRAALDEALRAAGVAAEVLTLDVEETESVDAVVAKIIDTEGRIDVLVNNAGVGFGRTTEQATEDDVNWVMNVNFMGAVRCTKAVLPHMRSQRSGKIIGISSVGGLVAQPFNEIYCASKFALEGYMEALASYVGPKFGIDFTIVEPGGIRSEFFNSAFSHFAATGGMLDDEYRPMIEQYLAAAQARAGESGVYQSADEVAAVVIDCLSNENPPIRIRTSPWAEEFCALKTASDPDGKKLQQMVIDRVLGGLPGRN